MTAASTGSNNGTVDWTFAAADKTFDYLGAGQTLTLTYTVSWRTATSAAPTPQPSPLPSLAPTTSR